MVGMTAGNFTFSDTLVRQFIVNGNSDERNLRVLETQMGLVGTKERVPRSSAMVGMRLYDISFSNITTIIEYVKNKFGS